MNDIIKALQFEKEQLEARIRILEDKLESDNRQISEYDHELRQAKRLLKAAVEDFSNMYDHIFDCDGTCDTCPLHGERDHCLKWYYADEAEKIIKEENEND